jgi:hypothetical protein
VSEPRRPAPAEPVAAGRPERRRFLAVLLGLGAAGVVAAEPAPAKPVEIVLDGGRP